jgi:hypothetical protein
MRRGLPIFESGTVEFELLALARDVGAPTLQLRPLVVAAACPIVSRVSMANRRRPMTFSGSLMPFGGGPTPLGGGLSASRHEA